MARRNFGLIVVLLIGLTFSACGGRPTSDVQALETQIAAKIFATLTASVPNQTRTPEATATPEAPATPEGNTSIPPRGKYKHNYTITEEFDRFKEATVVKLLPVLGGPRGKVNNLLVSYSYEGKVPAVPSTVNFTLASQADSWMYLKCYDLSWLLDGRIHMSPGSGHEGQVGDGYVLELITSKLSVDEFLQIVNAEKVEGKVCNTEFVLTPSQMEALRDVASRMQP
jgi:hypothetical protein